MEICDILLYVGWSWLILKIDVKRLRKGKGLVKGVVKWEL